MERSNDIEIPRIGIPLSLYISRSKTMGIIHPVVLSVDLNCEKIF
jgi:hypothetical protein